MYLPPLQPISDYRAYVSGDVSIDPSAAIAPGVLMQADPNSKIIIAAGVCIGMGAVLHAQNGTLEIAAGANLGAGVLFFGRGKVGENACIGSATTILNVSIERGQVIPPGSVVGNLAGFEETAISSISSHETATVAVETTGSSANRDETVNPNASTDETIISTTHVKTEVKTSEYSTKSGATVHGQMQLNKLMGKLFPQGQNLNNRPSNLSDNDGAT